MDDEIRCLRAEARRLAQGKIRSQVRYPQAFRRATVALARMRLRQGGSVTRLAQDVGVSVRSEEHTSELQSHSDLVCRLLLEKKKKQQKKKNRKDKSLMIEDST